jgi:hypothetical protein
MEIIDLLNKLINSERSERELGNVAAAETFAAKAQELLFKHKLTMTDLDYAAEEAEEPIVGEVFSAEELLDMPPKSSKDTWLGVLINALCKANFCKVIRNRGNNYTVVGRLSDRNAVSMLFVYLSKAAMEMSKQQAYDRALDGSKRSFITSFKLGFASAISERMRVTTQELKAGTQEQGLMRIDQLEKKVADTYHEMFPHAVSSRNVSCKNYSGFSAGKAYGHAVGIGGGPRLTGRTS